MRDPEIKRTDDEIVAKAREQIQEVFGGMVVMDLVQWLPWEKAKEFCSDQTTPEDFIDAFANKKPVREQMKEYMPFAWEKANNFRGLSAGRSLMHYENWFWLLGVEENFDGYEYYGKNELCQICEFLGIDSKQWDDGVRLNEEP